MNTQRKNFKIAFLLSVLFISAIHYDLKAQNVFTYYTFSSDVMEPSSLKMDAAGSLYFLNYDMYWNPKISKLTADGTMSNVVSGNYYPQSLGFDNAGNLFFFDGYSWPSEIKKVTPDGFISSFASGNFYPMNFDFNILGDLYFVDGNEWPSSIKKITTDGIVSTFLADPNIYPEYIAFDNSGNLYFTDTRSLPISIKKVTPNGTISEFFSGYFYPQSLSIDASGNMYFIDGNNWPNGIKKITPDGTLSHLANLEWSNYQNSLTIDQSGNVYFIDRLNDHFVIRMIQNPEAPCINPQPPVAQGGAAICHGKNILLSASGFGELRWYDAPTGGNLINVGSRLMTPALTTNTTYYIESYLCYTTSIRTELKVTVFPPPSIVITGSTTGFDSVVLTASGGVSYLWSGGNSTTTAQNTFTQSGTYSLTVKNEIGCADIVNTVVTVNVSGLDKYGNILSGRLTNVDYHGAVGAETKVDRYGKISNNSKNGLTTANAAASAYEIKQNFPASADGYYWIKNDNINGGTPFQIYADMTTDGGGWTLIMCNKNPNSGWTNANAVLRNELNPNNNGNYSIIAWADHIKKASTGFQYMMDAHTRGNYGGIWTANQPYSFVSRSNANTDITINTKFGNWNYFEGGGFGPRMPWWTTQTNDGIITTSQSGTTYWWGTLIAGSGWVPSPWLSGETGTLNMRDPGIIWYWVR